MKTKKAIKITAITISSIIILFLATIIIVPMFFQNKLVKLALKEANKMLYAEVSIEDFDLTLIKNFPNPTLRMKNVLVLNKTYFEGDTLAKLGEFDACFDLCSAFSGDYHLKKLAVGDATINVKFTEDSLHSFNWDIMIPDSLQVEDSTEEDFHINVRADNITIKNTNIHYSDIPYEMFMDFEALNLSLNGNLSDTVTDITLEMDSKSVNFDIFQMPLLSKAVVKINTELTADLNNWKFSFKENEILLNALALKLEGFIAVPDDIDMDLKLKLKSTEFKNILSMIPVIYAKDFADIKANGQVALDAYAKGKMVGDSYPAFGANLSIANAMFKYPDLPASVDDINIIAKVNNNTGILDNTVVDIPKFHLKIIENNFDLTAKLQTPISDPNLDFSAKGIINLNDIQKIYPIEEVGNINGVFKMDLAVKTLLSYIEKEQYNKVEAVGNLEIQDLVLKNQDFFDNDVLVPIAELNFTPKYIDLKKFEVKIGKNDLAIAGKLDDYLEYILSDSADLKGTLSINSNYLNITELLSQPIANTTDTTATATATATTQTETNDTASSFAIIEVPKFLNVKANANVKKLIYDNIELNNAILAVNVANSRLNINNLSANIFEGNIKLSGYYEAANMDFANTDMNINIDKIAPKNAIKTFGLFNKYMPVINHAEGLLSIDIKAKTKFIKTMTPDYSSTNIIGKLGLIDCRLVNVESLKKIADILQMDRIKSFTLKNTNLMFKIIDGKYSTEAFKFNIDKMNFNVDQGYVGLDKSLKYNTLIEIPKSYMNARTTDMVSKLQEKAKSMGVKVNESDVIKLNLKIGGFLNKPTFDIGLNEMKDKIVEEVKEVIKEEINKALDEAQAQAKKLLEEAQKQADALIANATKQSNALIAEAQKKADALVEAEKAAGEKLIEKAQDEANKMIASANNPIEKKAKELAAKKLIDTAKANAAKANAGTKTKADAMVLETRKKGNNLISAAKTQGDKLIENAKKQGDTLIENARKKTN